MSRIYTRSGDTGTTGLADGTRTSKTSARIEAIGTIDECNAHLGMLVSLIVSHQLHPKLSAIQHRLFDLGATLANKQPSLIEARHVTALERNIDQLDSTLPPLKQFILPGGNAATAQAHITRAVCRRAERCTYILADNEAVPEAVVQFLNRLSDYLFVVARSLSAHNGGDIPWLPENP